MQAPRLDFRRVFDSLLQTKPDNVSPCRTSSFHVELTYKFVSPGKMESLVWAYPKVTLACPDKVPAGFRI